MTEEMIVYLGVQELKKEIETLRTELSMLVLERDELQYVACKNIETAYLLEFGTLEYKIYEAECTLLRLKREIELIQARKKRQEPVVMFDIEITLDFEFAAYQARLDEETAKINEAIERSRRPVLANGETKELKRLYRKIVKALHPDLHPGVTGEQLRLFHNAVVAYENGDLETLRMIDGLLSLLHGKGGNVALPTPYEQDIFLYYTHVAGTTYVEGIEELEPHLAAGDRLALFREPDNPYDKYAIVIRNADGVKLGYVPRRDNIVFTRLMDAGKLLFACVSGKERVKEWLKIDIGIYMKD